MSSVKSQPTQNLAHFVLAYIWQHRWRFLLVLSFVIVAKLSVLAAPVALKFIVDQSEASQVLGQGLLITISLVIAYVFSLLVGVLFDELKAIASEIAVEPLVAKVGTSVFKNLISSPQGSLMDTPYGETIKDVERGLRSLQGVVGLSVHSIIPLLVELLIVGCFIASYYDYKYTLILLAGIALHVLFTTKAATNLAEARKTLNREESRLSGKFSEALNNHETIAIFATENYEARKFSSSFNNYARAAIQFQKTYSKIRVTQQIIVSSILLILLLNAGYRLSEGGLSSGDFVLINAMAMQILVPIAFMGTIWKDMVQHLVDAKILNKYLVADKPDISHSDSVQNFDAVSLKLDSVSYGVEGNQSLLRDVSFSIEPGSFTAIVGPSGSGKTTILKLLSSLVAPTSGTVFFNGCDLQLLSKADYLKHVAIVPQNIVLFHGSILDNIRYADRHATIESAIAASILAQLDAKVKFFPAGYDTEVGEKGLKLSGGEKQLLGVARAILKRPKLLLLDEPSSALDSETEHALISSLSTSCFGITRVVVAHRLASISHADQILVIDRGSVVERGTHTDLLRLDGLYAKLWAAQNGALIKKDAGLF